MHRLASLYNGVALVQMEVMHWEVLVDHYLREDDVLELRVQTCQKPVAVVPLFGPDVSDSMKRTVCSVNNCVTAVQHNTIWLAYFVEGRCLMPLPAIMSLTDSFSFGFRHQGDNVQQPKARS